MEEIKKNEVTKRKLTINSHISGINKITFALTIKSTTTFKRLRLKLENYLSKREPKHICGEPRSYAWENVPYYFSVNRMNIPSYEEMKNVFTTLDTSNTKIIDLFESPNKEELADMVFECQKWQEIMMRENEDLKKQIKVLEERLTQIEYAPGGRKCWEIWNEEITKGLGESSN